MKSIKLKTTSHENNTKQTTTITIKRQEQSKYLGLFLDENLNWKYQLEEGEGLLPKLTKINNSLKIIKTLHTNKKYNANV
jgi:hypothetical protein